MLTINLLDDVRERRALDNEWEANKHLVHVSEDGAVTVRDPHAHTKLAKMSRAHQAVASAIERGILTRPDACLLCGSGKQIEAHHDDYDKPLMVRWLCQKCHAKEHHDRRSPTIGAVVLSHRSLTGIINS